MDIFPVDEENPVRIEFFDDEIESIRYFDTDSQKSIKSINSIIVKPYFEFLVDEDVSEEEFGKQKFLPKYNKVESISNYLDDSITIFKDYDQIEVGFNHILEEIVTYKESKDTEFNGNYMFNLNDISVDYPMYYFLLNNLTSNVNISDVVNFGVKSISNFNENSELINKYIRSCTDSGKTVVIILKKYQIRSLIKNLNMKLHEVDFDNIVLGGVNLVEGDVNQGFIYKDLVVLSSKELFNNIEKKKKYNTKFKYSSSIKDITKLAVGDYVVHNVHGIGVYNGIKTLTVSGISKDYLEVLYLGTDKIYIPVEKIDLLSKYSGQEGVAPKVNKLGGVEWAKTKERVRKKINDVADKLLALYAERE